jgi:hypothetical protein
MILIMNVWLICYLMLHNEYVWLYVFYHNLCSQAKLPSEILPK